MCFKLIVLALDNFHCNDGPADAVEESQKCRLADQVTYTADAEASIEACSMAWT